MRPRLSIITLFRSPLKTMVTFLLLLATSFAFVSRGAEYAATVREIDRAEAEYSAVGTVQRTTDSYYEYMTSKLGEWATVYDKGAYLDRLDPAVAPLDEDAAELVLSNGHVLSGGALHVAGGLTSETLTNVTEQPLTEIPGYSEWNGLYLEGTFEMDGCVSIRYNLEYDVLDKFDNAEVSQRGYYFKEPIIRDPDLYVDGSDSYPFEDPHSPYGLLNDRDTPNHRLLASGSPWDEDHPGWEGESYRNYWMIETWYSYFDCPEVVPYVDYPFIDLTKLEREHGISDWRTALEDPEKYGLIRYQNYFGLPQVPALDYVDTLYRNFHTQELVYVPEMDSVHRVHSGYLYITDGRAITSEDTGNVCVIGKEYADKNGLKVGDRIEFEVSADTMTHSGRVFAREPAYPYVNYTLSDTYTAEGRTYAADISPLACEQSLSDLGLEPVTREYEIVGLWSDSRYDIENPYCYSLNTVFVPEATYPWPDEVEPRLMPSNFSFTLEHPGDMALMQDELGAELEALGYELVIDDEGYAAAKPSFDFMKLSSLIGFVGMALALLLSLILITYLFIIRKKHDYAIMRALGTPVPRANASLLVGLFALALAAVLLGTALAVLATSGFAADLSAQIGEVTGGEVTATLPGWTFGAFGAGTLALLLVFAWVGLVRIGRIPPLRLLQGK